MKKINPLIFFINILLLFNQNIYSQSWKSNIVGFDSNNRLFYKSDSEGNKIPDFSYAGYKNSESAIPNVQVVKEISPINGDNTQHIQQAIDEVGKLPLINGIRGALLLKKGKYNISGTIYIKYSGVVLRGEGDGEDPNSNTIIFGTGNSPDQRTIIIAGGGNNNLWNTQVSGTKTNIISDIIYVGDKSFQVENASKFKVGDNIIIVHPNTNEWLKAVDYGGTATDPGWTTSDALTILYNRFIKKISVDTINIDAPIFYTLKKGLSPSYIYKFDRSGIQTNIGIENLRVDIEIPVNDTPTNSNGNEQHAWEAIELRQIEDAWVKNCTMIHFGHSGIMTSTATRVTIDSCKAIDPISIITGERRYNFNVYRGSQLILVKNSYARYGRHDFVSNGTSSTSGCVFVNNISEKTYSSSEGHRWFSQGLLFDNIIFNSPNTSYVIAFYNRGDYGTSHGWSAVNSVAWNCNVQGNKNIIIQKPPTGQNYAIGCNAGLITGKTPYAPFEAQEGYIEGSNFSGLVPNSLFETQLKERLDQSTTSVENFYNEKLETKIFPVGDSKSFRPIKVRSTTGGSATGHYVTVGVISGNANTGSSKFSGGIDKVSSVRYYKVTYNKGAGAANMKFDKFMPSYGTDDGVKAGNVNLRVAYSLDERANWIGLNQTVNHLTDLTSPPTTITPDSVATPFQIDDTKSFYVALARVSGTTENTLDVPSEVEITEELPSTFELLQNYPNPFNPSTEIGYKISQSSFVTLKVYNSLGKEVATLVNQYQQPGKYNVSFSLDNYNLSSGVYYYTLKAGDFSQTKKMILIK